MGKNSGGMEKKKTESTVRVLRSRMVGVDLNNSDETDANSVSLHTSNTERPTQNKGNNSATSVYYHSIGVDHVGDLVNEFNNHHVRVHSSSDSSDEEGLNGNNDGIHVENSSLPHTGEKDPETEGVLNEQTNIESVRVPPETSYLSATMGIPAGQKRVNFRLMENITPTTEEVDVELPLSSVIEAVDRYSNMLYGYFVGKRLAYPVVKHYVMSVWKKYGIEKTMMNSKGFYFFKFSTAQGMLDVIENGPWMIRTVPIILNKWSPDVSLSKEDLTKVPVWVKLHDIPLTGYTADGLSMIASNIGKPIMLDSYTSTMCVEAWGRPNYARAMIEISADNDLKSTLKVGTPGIKGAKGTVDEITIEYKWQPPRCATCKVFRHKETQCPKHATVDVHAQSVDSDRFRMVKNNKATNDQNKKHVDGFVVARDKQKMIYRRKITTKQHENGKRPQPDKDQRDLVETSNSFRVLDQCNENDAETNNLDVVDEPSDIDLDDDGKAEKRNVNTEGASTPGLEGHHESHVPIDKLTKVCNSVFPCWTWTSNGHVCDRGTCIILGCDPGIAQVMVVMAKDQVIHCLLTMLNSGCKFFVSFVYAANNYIQRRLEESMNGSSTITIAMREFHECVDDHNMEDVNYTGLQFTWNQRPHASGGILKKIDRVMANDSFMGQFSDAYVLFQPYRISDHCPMVLKLPNQGNLHARVVKLRKELEIAQAELDKTPDSLNLRMNESLKLKEYKEAILEEECFLKQKSKVEWLRVGDSNSSYFHKVVKGRVHRNHIHAISDQNDNIVEGAAVCDVFVRHYELFLGTANTCNMLNDPGTLFSARINTTKANHMVRPVTNEEVKAAIFDIGDDKAPGPDGYSSAFFKNAWDVVGNDACSAIKAFFSNGQLLTEINHTIIALLPKNQHPGKVNDYRPISCCNVLYKCISKIITNRITPCLEDIVHENQSAFIPGRRISDNILLTQELMRNYHLDRAIPRCAFKVDIQKAYDTVDWGFLRAILVHFGFHKTMVKWIMKCVSTSSFSISINGNLCGFFKGKRGLRQGDPMSPYLFTLVMEVLSLMLKRNIQRSERFKFHPKCEDQRIINLCFADDLFLFSNADMISVKVIFDALDEFKECSGLTPSMSKSTGYFANVPVHIKNQILNMMPFEEGVLPVRYLGVPLVSSRLLNRDCKLLVEMVQNRIFDWKSKFLSFAGRVQLISSVLVSMQVYWYSVFILPNAIIKEIEKLMRGFWWCQGELKRGKAKVKWDIVCLPKEEGGLGIKRLKLWNVALLTSQVRRLLENKHSLWVKWIHTYRLEDRNFWDVMVSPNASWSWRKLLNIRDLIKNHIVHKIGNEECTSVWYDIWCDQGRLVDVISRRNIVREGFNGNEKLCDFVVDGKLNWPSSWLAEYQSIQNIEAPSLFAKHDEVCWKLLNGNIREFSVAEVWETIRPRVPCVSWYNVVWFGYRIPRHAVLLWFLMESRLKTQDTLKDWERNAHTNILCSLCNLQQDSHDHLFFECPFSLQICMNVVPKLVFAAMVYYIWQERNNRLFGGKSRSVDQMFKVIFSTVRLKLLSLKFKESRDVRVLKDNWKVP
ncbi:uncharacterized protein [Rutidosis leptorrhynchoides]|uniref:uncharacterized protein n=1 Tax=Rutidosis leptorrhynchoides TaxID=125765 RepID=UPI003A992E9B